METRENCLPIICIHIVISNIQFYYKYYINHSIPTLIMNSAIAFIANLQYIEQSLRKIHFTFVQAYLPHFL